MDAASHPAGDAPIAAPDGGWVDLVLDEERPAPAAPGAASPASRADANEGPGAPPVAARAVAVQRARAPRAVRPADLAVLLAAFVVLGVAVAVFGPRAAHPVVAAPAPDGPREVPESAVAVRAPSALEPRGRVRRAAARAARAPAATPPAPEPPATAPPDPLARAGAAPAPVAAEPAVAVFVPAAPRPEEPAARPTEGPAATPAEEPAATPQAAAPVGPPEAAPPQPAPAAPEAVVHQPRLADATCLREALAASAAGPGEPGDVLKVRLEVSPSGSASGVELLAGETDPRAAAAIRDALRGCRFVPASDVAGRPVRAWHVLEIAFVAGGEPSPWRPRSGRASPGEDEPSPWRPRSGRASPGEDER